MNKRRRYKAKRRRRDRRLGLPIRRATYAHWLAHPPTSPALMDVLRAEMNRIYWDCVRQS